MSEITQPHDCLFKVLMSHPDTAGAFLRESLPPEVSGLLAPDPPQLVEGSFVEERLRPYFSDRLFHAKTVSGKSLFLYVLLEHKSYEDKKVGWQIFRGLSAFMEQKTREDENWQQLPAILPMLLYHGQQEWRFPNEFLALVDADEALRPWLLNFCFQIVDLGPIPNKQLSQHVRLRAGLMALKFGTRNPQEQMEALEEIVSALEEAPELLVSILLYLLTTFQNLNEEQVRLVVRRINPMEEAEMMSQFAQEILTKGKPEWVVAMVRQEGRQEGRQEEAASMLLKQMRRKFGQTPDWVDEKVKVASLDLIETWSDNFVFANSVDEVFAS